MTRWPNDKGCVFRHAIMGAIFAGGLCSGGAVLSTSAQAEVPYFEDAVASGDLPPMLDRLPEHPKVIDFEAEDKTVGKYGGQFVTIMGRSKDIRMAVVYGYARLMKTLILSLTFLKALM